MRVATLLLFAAVLSPALRAQDVPAPVPASIALQLRAELELDETQAAKLRDLARAQASAYSRAMAAYLRAEADVIDAARGEDLVLRRTSLERRAKLAIDAEMARLKSEKDVRAVLNPRQGATLASLLARTGSPPWLVLVSPTPIAAAAERPVDSGEVRISVSPVYADIYMDGVKLGTGRKFIVLPVGKYEIKFHAVGCGEVVTPIEVTKGPPMIINQALTCGK